MTITRVNSPGLIVKALSVLVLLIYACAADSDHKPGETLFHDPAPAAGTSGRMDTDGGTGTDGGQMSTSCRLEFTSGINVAWFDFALDIPDPPLEQFSTLFDDITPVGGRVARWWFHTTGEVTPGYDEDGFAQSIPQEHIEGVRDILDTAESAGAMLVISIWSFDMLEDYIGRRLRRNNRKLLEDDDARQIYIDNYLVPLVAALKGHKGMYAWEVFNEPEGMTTDLGWTEEGVSLQIIQKNINWMAAAIRETDPEALITSSAWTFETNSNIDDYTNYYSDEELIRIGGKEKGTLDFYQVHYYDNWGAQGSEPISPFAHDISYWKLDKPVTIGEFWALDVIYGTDYKADDMYTILYKNGYSGAWAWQYANTDEADVDGYSSDGYVDARWPSMRQSMLNLKNIAGDDPGCPGGL